MLYCSGKNKASVYYEFADKKDSFISKIVPIKVLTGVADSGNDTGNTWIVRGRGVNFYDCSPTNEYYEASCSIKPSLKAGTYDFGDRICSLIYAYCGSNIIPRQDFGFHPSDVMIIPPSDICKIEIFDSTDNLLFSDTGKCPVKFTVACEDDCPPGTVRCECIEYPGYCCLPCEPTISEIKSIRNLVKKLK